MIRTQLSRSEIQDLINRYRSELNKLNYQVEDTVRTIEQLEQIYQELNNLEASASMNVESKGSIVSTSSIGKIRSNTGSEEVKAIRPVKKRSGYKLSVWDEMVIESIEKAGKVRITNDIIDYVKSNAGKHGLSPSDAEVRNKVIRSLQKLVNQRGDLAKTKHQGKGWGYVLPNWINSRGSLIGKYQR